MRKGMVTNMMKELELYLHIPFCARKCLYCDFLSAPADKATQDAYMSALIKEVEGRAEDYRTYTIVSVFIGGGTPSAVEPIWIERLMQAVRRHYQLAQDVEITLEINPGTVGRESLAVYKAAGINRISVGLQSAENEELKLLGRIHTWENFAENYYLLRELGFDNVNVDLMSGLPGQLPEDFRSTMEKVTNLVPEPEHISAYSLIVEDGTALAAMVERGELHMPDEEVDRAIYEMTRAFLAEKGYVGYEISNYAKPGYVCRHNVGYWRRVSYLGMGIGAASLLRQGNGWMNVYGYKEELTRERAIETESEVDCRFRNKEDLENYLTNPLACITDVESLDKQAQMEEFCFLGLRMTDGISLKEFAQEFGVTMEEVYGPVLQKNLENGLLQYHGHDGEEKMLALTEQGMNLANYVMAQFLQN